MASPNSNRQAVPLPEPATHQQTLRRSFAIGGVGLHSGEYALVRVLPAFAGEGRFFVSVSPGTNSHHWALEQPAVQQSLEEAGHGAKLVSDRGSEDLSAQLFFDFVEGQDTGRFSGTFADYLQQRSAHPPDTLLMDAEVELLPDEQPVLGESGEERLLAHVTNLKHGHRCCTVLARGDACIWGAEHLLAALEACGVDNARIEIEGGREVPIVDGSAHAWAREVQRVGVRPAPEVTVRDGEAFITYYPSPVTRVTVGLDCQAASVIGRQWFTWSPEQPGTGSNDHFCVALAPARTCYSSAEAVESLMADGLLQGGPDHVSLIGDNDYWLDASMVRFPSDEAARHAVVDLLGDLSLLASPGGRGLPSGHVVAYQPTHALHAKFVERLHQLGAAAV